MAVSRNTKHKTRNRKQSPVVKSKKLIVEFSGDLYARTESAVADLNVSRSVLIRCAVEFYLDTLKRRKLEAELAEGYIANAALDRRIAEEFAYSDSENI